MSENARIIGWKFNGGDESEALPPDLASIVGGLEALAAHDLAAVPEDLAGRIYENSFSSLHAQTPKFQPISPIGRIGPIQTSATPRRALAMAAGLALVATIGATWLAGHRSSVGAPGPTIANAEADLDAWLASPEVLDLALGESINEVSNLADEVARAVDASWMPDDLINPEESTTEESL